MKFGYGSVPGHLFPFAYIQGQYYDITGITDVPWEENYRSISEKVGVIVKAGELKPLNIDFKKEIPVQHVNQIRDFYAFEEHVRNSRKSRGLGMIDQWFRVPIYYFTNRDSLIPSGVDLVKPDFTDKLDLEVEIGIVLSKGGRDIASSDAMDHVLGLTLMNDWSARDIWANVESKLNLGPSKSKDFATSIGPYVTTIDELDGLWNGKSFDIGVKSYINGEQFSDSNMKDIYWGIPKLIEYCSMGTELKAGDILMTGTMPGGCIFERGDGFRPWLRAGDIVEIRSDVLGSLKNKVI